MKASYLYSDHLCQEQITQIAPGQAGIVGYYSHLSNWYFGNNKTPISTGLKDENEHDLYIRATYIQYDRNGHAKSPTYRDFGITTSGGSVLYNFKTNKTILEIPTVISDTITQSSSSSVINNAFFTGICSYGEDENILKRTAFVMFSPDTAYQRGIKVTVGSYGQTPWDGERQTWSYKTSDGYENYQFGLNASTSFTSNTRWSYVKVYSLTLEDGVDYFAYFIGVDFDGSINYTSGQPDEEEALGTTLIVAVPKAIYKDKIPKPYVGPVSPDSAAASFDITRQKYRDEVLGFNLASLDSDPFNLCSENGKTHLVLLGKSDYKDLCDGIYEGTTEDEVTDWTGTIGDSKAVNAFFGIFGTRSKEKLDCMLSAIQTIHYIPNLGITAGNAVNIMSLGGQRLSKTISSNLLTKQIYTSKDNTITASLGGYTNSFLDYGPYTTISLYLPWIGFINIDPSEVWAVNQQGKTVEGNLYIDWLLDTLTGLLTYIVYSEIPGLISKHIINTSQANVSTEIPLSGLGGANEKTGLNMITGALTTIAGAFSGNTAGVANGIISMAGTGIDASRQSSVNNSGVGSISPFLAPTEIGLIISYPKSWNADNYSHGYGMTCNRSGKVSEFKGYAEFSAVDLSTVNATDAEKEEIIRLLRGGVFV